MPSGVILAFFAYALYSCCDAITKGFGSGNLSVHEIAFWAGLFSFIPAIFTRPKNERWIDFWRMRHPWLVNLRSAVGVLGNMSVIFAFTTIPLTDTYSITFLGPIFIVILSVIFLKETVSPQRWFFLAMSFVGMLLVVRPGFRELQLGHLMALSAAMLGAVATTILRRVAPHEKRVSLIGLPLGYIVIVNGIWMIPDFVMPTWQEFGLFLVIGGLGGTGNVLFINATRSARASEVAPVQYSQIAWALIFGAVFFQEYPDLIAYAGLAVVVVFGIMNVVSGGARIRIFSRLSPFGPATVAAEIAKPIEAGEDRPETDRRG
ncbi:MAG TPA: DMT family transporter [Devosia sp.]|nr:DMT family transporter [Devosia sp.]